MPEVTDTGKNHSDIMLVSRFNRVIVSYRAAGLDNGGDADIGGGFDNIGEREHRIRSEDTSPGLVTGFFSGYLGADNPAGLSGSHTHQRFILGQHDGVRLYVLDRSPGKE